MTDSASRTTDGRGRLYEGIADTIGNTPCIRVNRLAPDHVRLYVKAEFFNPAASVKDRPRSSGSSIISVNPGVREL